LSDFIVFHDVESREYVRTIRHYGGETTNRQFSPDLKHFVSARYRKRREAIELWNLESGQLIKTIDDSASYVEFCPDRKHFVSAHDVRGDKGFKGVIKFWDIESCQCIRILDIGLFAYRIALNPNGKQLVTSTTYIDGLLKLWDIESGKFIGELSGHEEGAKFMAFSPKGEYFVISSNSDGTVKLWKTESGKLIGVLEDVELYDSTSISFSPDEKFIVASGSRGTVKVVEAKSGKLVTELKGDTSFMAPVTFSPDGKYIVSGSDDQTFKLWGYRKRHIATQNSSLLSLAESEKEKKPPTFKLVKTFEGDTIVGSVSFCPNGKFIISVGEEKGEYFIKAWSIEDGRLIKKLEISELEINDRISHAKFSPDGKHIIVAGHNINFFDFESGMFIKVFMGDDNAITSFSFSPDGKYIVSEVFKSIKLWDAKSATLLKTVKEHSSSVLFSPSGKYIAFRQRDTVKLLEAETWRIVRTFKLFEGGIYLSLAFSPDEKCIVAVSSNLNMKLWRVDDGQLLHTFKKCHKRIISSVVFSPDGKYIVSGSFDKTLKLWNPENGEHVETLEGHKAEVQSVSFSPSGKHIVSNSRCDMKLWSQASSIESDVYENTTIDMSLYNTNKKAHAVIEKSDYFSSMKLNSTFESGQFFSCSQDGKFIVTERRNDASLQVWETENGQLLSTIKGHSKSHVNSAVFSPNGEFIITGGFQDTLKLWETCSGQFIRDFEKNLWSVYNIAFSPNGKFIISCGEGHLTLWGADDGRVIRTIKESGLYRKVAFSPDGKYIVSGGNRLELWKVDDGQLIQTFKNSSDRHFPVIDSVAFSPDGKYVAATSARLRLWKIDDGQLLHILDTGGYNVDSIAFSPDSKFIISENGISWPGGTEEPQIPGGGLRFWNVDNGQLTHTFETNGIQHHFGCFIKSSNALIIKRYIYKFDIWCCESSASQSKVIETPALEQINIENPDVPELIDTEILKVVQLDIEQGNLQLEKGDYSSAIKCFTVAINIDPKNATAYCGRGSAYLKKSGSRKLAMQDFEKALSLNPDNAFAKSELEILRGIQNAIQPAFDQGNLHYEKGEYGFAIKHFSEVIILDPDNVPAYCGRGSAYRMSRQYNQAIEDFTTAINLDPENAVAYCGRGAVYMKKFGKKKLAKQDFEKALNFDPDNEFAKSELNKL